MTDFAFCRIVRRIQQIERKVEATRDEVLEVLEIIRGRQLVGADPPPLRPLKLLGWLVVNESGEPYMVDGFEIYEGE